MSPGFPVLGVRRRTVSQVTPASTNQEGSEQMNKNELITATADSTGMSKSEVTKVLDSVVENISSAVQQGDKVAITGFGTFERRERAARTGRNPQTGESLEVAASKAPAFKPAKAFKDAVNT